MPDRVGYVERADPDSDWRSTFVRATIARLAPPGLTAGSLAVSDFSGRRAKIGCLQLDEAEINHEGTKNTKEEIGHWLLIIGHLLKK